LVLLATGALSTGGLTALAIKKVHAHAGAVKTGAAKSDATKEITNQQEGGI
jgi:hypothetical protein